MNFNQIKIFFTLLQSTSNSPIMTMQSKALLHIDKPYWSVKIHRESEMFHHWELNGSQPSKAESAVPFLVQNSVFDCHVSVGFYLWLSFFGPATPEGTGGGEVL